MMRSRLNRIALSFLLTMLVLVSFLIKSRKPAPDESAQSVVQPEIDLPAHSISEVDSACLSESARPEASLPIPEQEPGMPDSEGSWGRELRELGELALQDPEAALRQAAQQPTSEERDEAVREVCLQIAHQDPARALTNAWNLQLGINGDSSTDYMALENISKRWAESDLTAAIAWVSEQKIQEHDDRRDWILKGLASVSSNRSPEEAARLVSEQILPGQVQLQAAISVLKQWAAIDFASASAWAEQFPEGGMRDTALEQLAHLSTTVESETNLQ